MVEAHRLVEALLESDIDPKRFLHGIRKQQAAKAQPKPYKPPPVVTQDCHDWEDWEDLETWQRIAAVEMQQAEDMEFKLGDYGLRYMNLHTGNVSFMVYEDDDAARAEAVEQVENDIENEPGLFEQTWLQQFIDTDRLKEMLKADVEESNRNRYDDEWRDAESKRDGLIGENSLEESDFQDEEGNWLEITPELEAKIDEAYEEFIDNMSERELEDPMEYLEGIYGEHAAPKEAMRIVGIDTSAAAESAVDTDGWQHFLARYDGNSTDLPSGSVYVRT